MFERLKEKMNWIVSHRTLYAGLGGAHGWAAYTSGKPEIYVPMVVLYGALAWVQGRH